MKRLHLFFPEQLLLRLQAAKKATGLPVAELIRSAIIQFLDSRGL